MRCFRSNLHPSKLVKNPPKLVKNIFNGTVFALLVDFISFSPNLCPIHVVVMVVFRKVMSSVMVGGLVNSKFFMIKKRTCIF
jgi:hypothetical protein